MNASEHRTLYEGALMCAAERSLSADYKGCSVHVNAIIGREAGLPAIIGYALSDWYSDTTVATYVNGRLV